MALVRLRSLGDVVLAGAAVEALAGRARTLLVTGSAFAPLYASDPRLAGVVGVTRDGEREAIAAVAGFAPEIVVDLQRSPRSRRLVRALRAPRVERVRKDGVRRRLLLVGIGRGRVGRRTYERYLDAVERALPTGGRARPRLVVTESLCARARTLLPEGDRPWVVLVPGASWANKRWPSERFGALARALGRDKAARVAVVGGPGEDASSASVARLGAPYVDAVLAPTLQELPAILSRASVVVTGDSGPLHVAEAVGTPVVALFGPTIGAFGFRPFRPESRVVEKDLWCRPCHLHGGRYCPLGHRACMNDIHTAEVLSATRAVLERGAALLAPGAS